MGTARGVVSPFATVTGAVAGGTGSARGLEFSSACVRGPDGLRGSWRADLSDAVLEMLSLEVEGGVHMIDASFIEDDL